MRSNAEQKNRVIKAVESAKRQWRKIKRACPEAVYLIFMEDEFRAYFEDAEIVSEVTKLPVSTENGWPQCSIGAVVAPVVAAILAERRHVVVIEPDGEGRQGATFYDYHKAAVEAELSEMLAV